ncbi:MAG: M23 family metallopeptidase [Rickettsiales bacterium]|jgi:murein DD-endopeptidase MepM/ murein hydrolase activator NlpD|nr:M23 family metallopeptidase [Rickettsiales bacterium]
MLKNLLGAERIVLISDKGIESKRVGFFSKMFRLGLLLWTMFSSVSFFFGIRRQANWLREFSRLRLVNVELSEKVENLGRTVSELGRHLHTMNYYDRFSKFDMSRVASVNYKGLGQKNDYLDTKNYGRARAVLANVAKNVSLINDEIELRVKGLNNVLKLASLDDVTPGAKGDGVTSRALQNMRHLNLIEDRLNSAPLMEPMRNYRISSHYGLRPDPFSRKIKNHNGIDLAGPYKSNIIAPAQGVVVVVRSNRDLGKTVILDHGYGVTTTYGHLDKSYVDVGDRVNRGDVIAVQGDSGIRSTGSHLHYEVSVPITSNSGDSTGSRSKRTSSRIRTSQVNPGDFIQAGKLLDIAVGTDSKLRKSKIVVH